APPGPTGAAPRMEAVPALGEHTRAVLGGLGLSGEDIDALVADGVV
ncbi:CoA transferase, partial [Streptomyces coelicoflavus]|nr:CoA transferase [Streptomyces coelicoflavus]